MVKLLLKGLIFCISLVCALVYPDILVRFFTYNLSPLKVFHIVWFCVVVILIKRLIPQLNHRMSTGKAFQAHYSNAGEDSSSRREKFIYHKKKVDKGAIRSAVYWTILIIVIGMLYYYNIFNYVLLFVIVIFFIFMDQFCITVWCPFQWLMRNKCCNACRINNWGYFMAFSPLIFIPSFWTYSILFLSVMVVVQWEYLYYRYPERFYEYYNTNLMCKNCESQTRCKG